MGGGGSIPGLRVEGQGVKIGMMERRCCGKRFLTELRVRSKKDGRASNICRFWVLSGSLLLRVGVSQNAERYLPAATVLDGKGKKSCPTPLLNFTCRI